MGKLNKKCLNIYKGRLEIAGDVYEELAGKKEYGISITYYGNYLICDDGQDRWLALVEDYQSALDDIIEKIMESDSDSAIEYYEDECYSILCSDCGALYSRIGAGEYNNKTEELEKLLLEELETDEVSELFRELGI